MNLSREFDSKSSAIHKIVLTVIVLFIWITISFSRGNSDYSSYEYLYNSVSMNGLNKQNGLEIGQQILFFIGSKIGLQYGQFITIYTSFAIIILLFGLKSLTDNMELTLIFYTIFPMLFDVIQVRNFFASSILVFAFHYLIDDNTSKGIFIYTFFILVAGTIHTTAYFFMVFILGRILKGRWFYFFCLTMFMALTLSSFLFSHLFSGIFFDKFATYQSLGQFNLLNALLYAILFIFLNLILYRVMKNHYNSSFNDNYKSKLTLLIFKSSLLISTTYPLVLINSVFFRIFRDFLIIAYSAITLYLTSYELDARKKSREILIFLIFIFSVANAYVWLFSPEWYSQIVIPIFTNNQFFTNI